MNRTLASLAATALLGGTAFSSLAWFGGERLTFALEPTTAQVFFVGIQADYDALTLDEATRVLREELSLEIVGESQRAFGNVQRRVWAFRASDPGAAVKELKKAAKKKGFVVERLEASVVIAGRDPISSSAARAAEALDERVWTAWLGPRGGEMWLFHESKLTPKALEKALQAAKLPASWQHSTYELTCTAPSAPDLAALEKVAAEKLDLVSARAADGVLTLDVYLRGMDVLAPVQQDKVMRFCPDVRTRLVDASAPASTGWTLTFADAPTPFD